LSSDEVLKERLVKTILEVTTMPIEKPVILYPLPAVDWQPTMSVAYRVRGPNNNKNPKDPTRDTWISVARKHQIDPAKLIWFNFLTENPDQVNWYLRRNVGCNVATPDGRNWMFSDSASPGIIYLPIDRHDMDRTIIQAKKTISPFAKEFEGPSSPLDKVGKAFDVFQMIDIAAAIAGIAAGELLLLGVGIAIAPFALFVAIGGPHEAALNELRKKQILEGIGLGIVLTADGRSVQYIASHGYVKKSPVPSINYPQYGKQLQGIFNESLRVGIIHGRDFNTVARANLWKFIGAHLNNWAKSEYSGDRKNWTDTRWMNWYRLCAGIVATKLTVN
jgi:hypothetical protein